jgi:ribonucleoside-diphosphate reductase alpha chain
VAPEFSRLNHLYQTLWEVESIDYLTNVASMQKFVCQSISTNTTYDPSKGQIKMSKLIGDLLFAYKKGLKTLYYCQVNDVDGSMDDTDDDGCGGACKV